MGQTLSSEGWIGKPGSSDHKEVRRLGKDEINEQFQAQSKALLRGIELSAIIQKANLNNLNDKNVITPSDLAYLLQLSAAKEQDISSINKNFGAIMQALYESLKVMSAFPFVKEAQLDNGNLLTIDGLIVGAVFHTGRYKKLLSDFDYQKILFISLAYQDLYDVTRATYLQQRSQANTASSDEKGSFPLNSDSINVPIYHSAEENVPDTVAWNSFITDDYIDVADLKVSAYQLHQYLTLFLVLMAIPKAKRSKMQASLNNLLVHSWPEFEKNALALIKHIDLNITDLNIRSVKVSYGELFMSDLQAIPNILKEGFASLFNNGLLSSNYNEDTSPGLPDDLEKPALKKPIKFESSLLVNHATVAAVSCILKSIGSNVQLTTENLVKLYTGKESGFSIRSLELKIFKWQAPTLFVVSGKRLKTKTATTNRRYIQFDNEYPKFFRSVESHLQPWQHDNDKITYAVLVTQPWRASNKSNFGDSSCIILRLSPQVDYFKSTQNPVVGNQLIYFNTLGLGVGFGNDQPINKNGIKKYLPGDVSLTIESNLEFAVFRHTASNKGSLYFNRSRQPQASVSNYEDRFMITDLEVWGVGSTKELEHQQKQWEWEQKQAEARQSVNLDRLREDRSFLEMAGLVGNMGGSGGSM